MTTREQALEFAEDHKTGYGDESRALRYFLTLEAENARLRKALDKANIWSGTLRGYMPSHGTYAEDMINLCSSIQHVTSEALAGSPAAQPTPEDKPEREWHSVCEAIFGTHPSESCEEDEVMPRCCRKQWRTPAGPWNDAPTQETK